VVGTNSQGNASNELSLPQGIFLHRESNTLYVADTGNRCIQMLSLNQSSTMGVTIASNIDSLAGIYVDDDGITIYAALRYENCLEKWIKGESRGEQVSDQCKQCTSVWVDKEKNVYMTESGTHTVLKWSPETNTIECVAGKSRRTRANC
jgi:sugar lactone lactonase YvrE